jgi:uncharacterized caspase-like protein
MTGNDWAIVIGINAYEFLPADDHLKYAVNDAVKVRQFLCEQAKFPQENVLLCCDNAPGGSPQQRPSRNALRHLLKNEIQRAKGAHNFWFFYAGHGVVHDHQDFLLPCDGNPCDLTDTAIPISFVTDCLRDCGAEHVVLVMDMCRNRTRGTDEGSRDIGEVMGEQTQQIAKAQGIVTLFSCSRGERSYEIKDLEQGAFTCALLEGLQQTTTPRALEQYLAQRVTALNRQHGKASQTPRVIPEPGWKYDRPLLLRCATPRDINEIQRQAWKAEAEENVEQAKVFWRQVIEADRSTQSDRKMAMDAISRIDKKIKDQEIAAYEQRRTEEERQKEIERQLELERQQALERQQQAQIKQEAAKQRQAEAQEGQRQEAEELKQQRQEEAQRRQAAQPANANELASEKGIDYTRLRNLLKTQDWKAADKETADRMCEAMGRQEQGWLREEDAQNFPRTDIHTIDQLWVRHSQGKFGFSVQKKIWQECGSPTTTHNTNVEKFCVAVGWRKKGFLGMNSDLKDYSEITFDTTAPKGHLPRKWNVGRYGLGSWSWRMSFLFYQDL